MYGVTEWKGFWQDLKDNHRFAGWMARRRVRGRCALTCPKAVACEELVRHVAAELSMKAGPVVGAVPPPGIVELLEGGGSRRTGRQPEWTGGEQKQPVCDKRD